MFRATATFLVAKPRLMWSRGVHLVQLFRSQPSFLVEHALNPELLDPLLMESFHVPGAGVPMVLLDYLRIQEDSLSERLYLGRSFLARNVEVSIPNQSYPFFLSINVSLDNPEMAAQIANRLVERLAEADRLRQGRATKDPPRNGSSVESTGHFPWSLIVKAGEVSRKGPSRWWIQNGWEARRTTVFNRKVRAEKDKGIRKEYDLMKAHLNERAIFTGEWDYTIVPRILI